jgi:hypothetical protein
LVPERARACAERGVGLPLRKADQTVGLSHVPRGKSRVTFQGIELAAVPQTNLPWKSARLCVLAGGLITPSGFLDGRRHPEECRTPKHF